MAVVVIMRRPEPEEPHLPAFLADLTLDNMSPRTIREKRLTILRVARDLGHPVADATPTELHAWQLDHAYLKPASMHNAIVHLAVYYRWLVINDHRTDDPSLRGLHRPRHPHVRMPRPMPDEAISRALQAAGQPMHAWISLGAFCGLRCMEIAHLRGEDVVDSRNPYLRILGKGGRERPVTLPRRLRDELVAEFPGRGWMFGRMDGAPGPPSPVRVSERINRHLHDLGIPDTAHALRHRFGTKLYEATGDALLVAEQMGHASTDTTRLYVKIVADRARDAVEAISELVA